MGVRNDSYCGALWEMLVNRVTVDSATMKSNADLNTDESSVVHLLAAHLTCIAVAGQEIHRGRPHAAFQVGGRDKLVDLCGNVAQMIHHSAMQQCCNYSCEKVKRDMDGIISELIELERSVFQGGEHVSAITFAQCIATAWGRIARLQSQDKVDDVVAEMMNERTHFEEGPLCEFPNEKSHAKSPEIAVAEIRDQLNRGLTNLNLSLVRIALTKCWYLGFLDEQHSAALVDDYTERSKESKRKRRKNASPSGRAKQQTSPDFTSPTARGHAD